ncbi:MAG: bifunctional diaminohydroxyphosphoribosylaminopyrimidine deaminase/5-amino-6-(5-phosphoribosylamino)uracil reductase RibD [Flavobacteriales bacterium]
MQEHNLYMQRCLNLAIKGLGSVAPNPMVGCVIVYNNEIIGEGYHEFYGGPHAEVNAINSVLNKELLKEATVYVSLEPCNHYGKTPPCSDLLVHHKVKRVVIGCSDSYEKVAGKGIKKLQSADIEVITGVLEKECRALNKRFFTFHEKKRPYIFLKWAQTQDGFISRNKEDIQNNNWISGEESKTLVHQWRSEEGAILIGYNTALIDNPQLTTRLVEGKNSLRLIIDTHLKLPANLHIFDNSTPTIIFNSTESKKEQNTEWVKIETIKDILDFLYLKNITSLFVEGGAKTLQNFIDNNLWDEAMVFVGNQQFQKGIKAPMIQKDKMHESAVGKDKLLTFIN